MSAQLGLFLLCLSSLCSLTGLLWGWDIALILLLTIVLHEAGHWFAIRLHGHNGIQILPLPMLGGVTYGPEQLPPGPRLASIHLIGSLPGIILGWTLYSIFGLEAGWISTTALILLTVNYLNLLPITPFDGGQLIKSLAAPGRLGLAIVLELLGAASFFTLAWMGQLPLLAALGILPLRSALELMKRRRIIKALDALPAGSETESVIAAIDHSDRRFRPLAKKAPEIDKLLNLLRLKPMHASGILLFLALHLGTFILPPITSFALSSQMAEAEDFAVEQTPPTLDSAYRRARSLPMKQLLGELATYQSASRPYGRQRLQHLLYPPASSQAIEAAEQRLGNRLDSDYRAILSFTNGFPAIPGTRRDGMDYYLLPLERVRPFAAAEPALFARLRDRLTEHAGQPLLEVVEQTTDGHYEESRQPLETLASYLLIGVTQLGEYLLLEPPRQPATRGKLLVVSLHLGNWRYLSLHDYLAYQLALMQSGIPSPPNR